MLSCGACLSSLLIEGRCRTQAKLKPAGHRHACITFKMQKQAHEGCAQGLIALYDLVRGKNNMNRRNGQRDPVYRLNIPFLSPLFVPTALGPVSLNLPQCSRCLYALIFPKKESSLGQLCHTWAHSPRSTWTFTVKGRPPFALAQLQ